MTWEPGRNKWSQGETLQVWDSVETIKNAMTTEKTGSGETLTVSGNLVREGNGGGEMGLELGKGRWGAVWEMGRWGVG